MKTVNETVNDNKTNFEKKQKTVNETGKFSDSKIRKIVLQPLSTTQTDLKPATPGKV